MPAKTGRPSKGKPIPWGYCDRGGVVRLTDSHFRLLINVFMKSDDADCIADDDDEIRAKCAPSSLARRDRYLAAKQRLLEEGLLDRPSPGVLRVVRGSSRGRVAPPPVVPAASGERPPADRPVSDERPPTDAQASGECPPADRSVSGECPPAPSDSGNMQDDSAPRARVEGLGREGKGRDRAGGPAASFHDPEHWSVFVDAIQTMHRKGFVYAELDDAFWARHRTEFADIVERFDEVDHPRNILRWMGWVTSPKRRNASPLLDPVSEYWNQCVSFYAVKRRPDDEAGDEPAPVELPDPASDWRPPSDDDLLAEFGEA